MPRLTLTFDNGPVAGVTGEIVELLAARGHKATFFFVGNQLAEPAARREAERAHRAGHWIGNHTLTHSKPLGERTDPGHAVAEIAEAQRIIGELAHPDRLFRPVGGGGQLGKHLLGVEAADFLITNHDTMVIWNNVPRDWVAPKEQWLDRALSAMASADWSLLVLHDHCLGDMLATLGDFLDRIDRRGIDIVQKFPDRCVPIRRGQTRGLAEFVSSA